MKRVLTILLSLTIIMIAKLSVGQNTVNFKLKKQLDSVYELDQRYRAVMMDPAKKDSFIKSMRITPQQADNAVWSLMRNSDSTNINFIEKIIGKHGYPGKSIVGEPTNEAAWNVIQHSTKIHVYIALIKDAAEKGELPFRLYAMMFDRDLMNQGKEQVYGTQVRSQKIKSGKMATFVWPIQDPDGVNERRSKAGFDSTIEENARKLGVTYHVMKMDEIK